MVPVTGSFATWIDGSSPAGILAFAVLALLATEIVVLGHELGHAAVGILRTEGLVVVRVGRRPALWKSRLGRLRLELNPVPSLTGRGGEAWVHAPLGTASRVVLVLAGPTAGALVAAVLFAYGREYHLVPLALAGGFGILLNLANLVPFRWRGCRSDGAGLLEAMRSRHGGKPADPLAEACSRWVVLYSDLRSAVAPEQMRRLGGAPIALGHRHDDRSEAAVVLWRLAIAGWCWREAERADLSAIREEVLDERQAAVGREAGRDDIPVSAARELALKRRDDADLDAAFTRLRPFFPQPPLHPEKERFAFRFGVALHDVERIAS